MMATRHPEKASGLDPLVLARWTKFLTPDKDPNPLLSRWHHATEADEQEVALAYQREFDEQFKDWTARRGKWNQLIASVTGQ